MKLLQKRLKQIEVMEQKTPEEIAEIIGVSRATYFNFKNGSSIPDMNHLQKLINRFKYSADWFYNEGVV